MSDVKPADLWMLTDRLERAAEEHRDEGESEADYESIAYADGIMTAVDNLRALLPPREGP